MKILLIGNIPEDLQSAKGGVESAILNLMEGFQKIEDIQVRIVSFQENLKRPGTFHYSRNIEVHLLPVARIELFSIFFTERNQIRKNIREFHPDVIHYQGSGPHLLSLMGIPRSNVVITIHGVLKEESKHQYNLRNTLKFWFKSLIDTLYLKSFRNFIFISEYNQRQIRFKIAAGTIIPNAINARFFTFPGKKEFTNRLIYTGAIRHGKNLLLALKAINNLKYMEKRFTLDVVGGTKDKDYKEIIDNYIRNNNLGDSVTFHGWVKKDEIGELLQQADMLILPSHQECLPISIAEAMAAGKLVIASRVGGIPEMISHNETGLLFEKNNESQLTDILADLYDNPENAARMATNAARKAAENYDAVKVAIKTITFYRTLINQPAL
jgi:glycosyltransferase involved in cell wall biosynthesis